MVSLDLRDREKKFKDGRHVGLDFYDLLIEGGRGKSERVASVFAGRPRVEGGEPHSPRDGRMTAEEESRETKQEQDERGHEPDSSSTS